MPNFNSVVLVGHLTRDPELKYSPDGTAIAEFGIAVNQKWKKSDELKERVDFFDVTTFARVAEVSAEHLKKGRGVLILGQLRQDRWEDKESGKNRSKVSVIARQVQFLGNGASKDDPKGAQEDSSSQETPQGAATGNVPF